MHTPQYLAIDVETTGLDSETSDIIELAAIPLDETLYPREEITPYHTLIKPRKDNPIDNNAIRINGHRWVYDQGDFLYKQAQHPSIAWRNFYDWMTQYYENMQYIILVGWNISFDEAFLKKLYKRGAPSMTKAFGGNYEMQKPWPFNYHKMDLITICRFIDICTQKTRKSYSLEKIAKDVCDDAELATFKAHKALDDISISLKVLQHMLEESRIPLRM